LVLEKTTIQVVNSIASRHYCRKLYQYHQKQTVNVFEYIKKPIMQTAMMKYIFLEEILSKKSSISHPISLFQKY